MDDLLQDFTRRGLDQLERSHARLAADGAALQRWVLGALLLLNAAALVALAVMYGKAAPSVLTGAAGYFLAGAGACVAAAIAALLFNLARSRAIARAIAQWAEASASGELPDEAMDAAARIRAKAARGQIVIGLLGLAALVSFVAGAGTLASGLGVVPDEGDGASSAETPEAAPLPLPDDAVEGDEPAPAREVSRAPDPTPAASLPITPPAAPPTTSVLAAGAGTRAAPPKAAPAASTPPAPKASPKAAASARSPPGAEAARTAPASSVPATPKASPLPRPSPTLTLPALPVSPPDLPDLTAPSAPLPPDAPFLPAE